MRGSADVDVPVVVQELESSKDADQPPTAKVELEIEDEADSDEFDLTTPVREVGGGKRLGGAAREQPLSNDTPSAGLGKDGQSKSPLNMFGQMRQQMQGKARFRGHEADGSPRFGGTARQAASKATPTSDRPPPQDALSMKVQNMVDNDDDSQLQQRMRARGQMQQRQRRQHGNRQPQTLPRGPV